jgi:hypothetical protein
VSWEHLIVSLSVLDDQLDWVSEVSGREVIPPSPPAPLPTVRQVLTALAGAGCHGLRYFKLAGDDLRPLVEAFDIAGPDDKRFGALMLDGPGLDSDAVDGDMQVERVTLVSAWGYGVLAAALALRDVMKDVLIFDAGYNGSFVLMMADDEESRIVADWPW